MYSYIPCSIAQASKNRSQTTLSTPVSSYYSIILRTLLVTPFRL